MVSGPHRAQPRLYIRIRTPKSLGPRATYVGLDRSRYYGAWLTAASTRFLRQLHRQSQSEGRQDHRKSIEPRIAPLRECPIQCLARKPGPFGQSGHTAHGVDDGAERNRYGTRVTVLEHRLKVRGHLGLASQVLRRAERAAWGDGLCSLSSTHWLFRYPLPECSCRRHIKAG